jgi:hypothetical protein
MAFSVTPVTTLASAVANAATVTVAYPAGTTQASFIGANAAPNTGFLVLNGNEVYPEATSGVRVSFSYGAGDVTVTNTTGVTWAAGSTIRVQFGRAGTDRPGINPNPAITSLTDSSGGTASDTLAAIGGAYVEATIENTVASLALKTNQILVALRAAGIILP